MVYTIAVYYLILVAVLYGVSPAEANTFDQAKAEKTYRKCRACHEIGMEAKNKVGPHLNEIVGRRAGSIPEFKYSRALLKKSDEGLVWDIENLDAFLKKPKALIKGTKMTFAGIKKADERNNLLYWLASLSSANEQAKNLTLLGASAAQLNGDPDYGEYLSGECVTCHQSSGANDGIPGIVGWPKEEFIHALYEYKTGLRENPAMVTVAKRLGDEEMAGLATYFSNLNSK